MFLIRGKKCNELAIVLMMRGRKNASVRNKKKERNTISVLLSYKGCVRVILKNNKKSLFARSGLKKMAENHHFSVRVSNK